MRWMREHKVITVLIVILIAAVIVFSISFSRNGEEGSGAGFVNRIYSAVEKPMTKAGSSISEHFRGMFSYREVKEENDRLKKENEKLKIENSRLMLQEDDLKELQNLSDALGYEFINSGENIVSANIVSISGSSFEKTVTIGKGTENGIKIGDTVLIGESLGGVVLSTGEGWSKISTVFDEKDRISFKSGKKPETIGIVAGSSDGKLHGFLIDSKAKIPKGDVIVTSGMGRFPDGIRIGTIESTKYNVNKQLMEVTVKSDIDFGRINRVSVVIS